MNEYNFNVKFEKGRISSNLKKLVQNDYNSTKINFTFDKEGRKLFKMLYPDETAYITQIDNDELMFGPGVLSQDGTYEVEIAVYTEDGRLTDYATTKFDVRAELIQSDEIVELDDRLPILDSLIGDVQGAKTGIEDAIQYATEQGDYAKEQANRNFDAIEEATKIVDNFEKNVINGIDAFNTNATTKLNEYNTNSSNKLEEYNSNATEKIEEYNANADNLTSIAIDTRNELERVKNDILETGEANGNYLTLNDSTMAELQELEVNSVEKQVTTTGKNLCKLTSVTGYNFASKLPEATNSNFIIEEFDSNSFSYSVKSSNYCMGLTNNIVLEPNTTYILSMFRTDNNVNNYSRNYIYEVNSDGSYSFLAEKGGTGNVETEFTTGTTGVIALGLGVGNNSNGANGTIKNIMISRESGEYEPYTGLKASPSPDYPQKIPVITTDSVLKSVGKNLFDKDNPNILKNVYFSGNKIISSSTSDVRTLYIPCLPNTTYTIAKIISSRFRITTTENTPAIGITGINYIANDSAKILSFTTASNARYLCIYYYSGNTDTLTEQEILDSIQIEEGSTATEYEPYQESILNMPIPEGEFVGYINEQFKDAYRVGYNEEDGNYHLYLDKVLGRVVLDGTQFAQSYSGKTYKIHCFELEKKAKSSDTRIGLLSNKYIECTRDNLWNHLEEGFSYGHANYYYKDLTFYSEATKEMNGEQIRQWLKENPIEVVYILAEPYTLDLGVVDMPLSYDGVTNIFVDADLLMNINTKYYRNFTETIRNLQINNDTLKNELASIESRLSALETAQTSIVSESEVEE